MKISYLCAGLLLLMLSGCDDKNEDKTKDIDKSGAVETRIEVIHMPDGQHDILTTNHMIWKERELIKTITTHDTLPSLGLIATEGEDNSGNTQSVTVPKDYEVYITVK